MAEIWGIAIATVGAAVIGANAAGDAADSANAGQQAGIAEQRAAREQFQQNINPYLDFGKTSMGQLNALNGGDYSGFMNSPDYLAAQQASGQMLDRSAAARGGFMGGGADADRVALGQQLATQYLGNYRNSLQFGTQLGQNSAVGAGQQGQQSANAISGAYGQMGANAGNAGLAQASIYGNALGGLGNMAGQYMGQRSSSYQQPAASTPRQMGPYQ